MKSVNISIVLFFYLYDYFIYGDESKRDEITARLNEKMDRMQRHKLYSDSKTITRLQKPDKIYLHDPNMFYALGYGEKIGTIRECFLINQLSVNHTVEYGKEQGDFIIDGNITIEVGGPDKTFVQVANIPNSYIFADRIELPVGKKLPLWMAGLVY